MAPARQGRSPRTLAFAAAIVGCAAPTAAPQGRESPAPAPAPATPATPTPPPPAPAWQPHPTLATAGADECRPGPRSVLGPAIDVGDPHAGFGAYGGLVAWVSGERSLALQLVDTAGTPRAPQQRLEIPAGYHPRHVVAVGDRFVVLLVLWDWQASRARWSALAVAQGGAPHGPPLALDLDDRDVSDAQTLADDRLAVLAGSAAIAPPDRRDLPGRWLELGLAADGALSQRAADFPTHDRPGRDDYLAPANLRPAELAGRRGWIVERREGRDPEGVWDGRRAPVADARLLASDDVVRARVGALDETPPLGRRVGGTIYEPLHTPALHRTRDGQPLGRVTALEFRGLHHLDNQLVWTGARFLVVHRDYSGDASVAVAIAIDCTPP